MKKSATFIECEHKSKMIINSKEFIMKNVKCYILKSVQNSQIESSNSSPSQKHLHFCLMMRVIKTST